MVNRVIHIVVCNSEETEIQKSVLALAQEQKGQGFETEVWCLDNPSFFLSTGYTDLKVFDTYKNPFALSDELLEEIDNLPSGSVIHLHGGFVPQFHTIVRIMRNRNRNDFVVLSPHGLYNEHCFQKRPILKKIYFKLFERTTIRYSSMVHLLGPAEVHGYNAYTNKKTPFISLPYGRSTHGESGFQVISHDGMKDPFIIAYAGLLQINKYGIDILLESFAVFSRQVYTPVELWLITNDENIQDVENLIQKHRVSEIVRIKRYLSESHRTQLLAQPHMFVNTSRSDTITSVTLEAATRGIPLIVSEGTNMGPYVKQHEAGWLLEHNTVEDLLQTLHEAYVIYKTDDAAYTSLRRNSYHMIRETLNWNSIAKKWREIYARHFASSVL